VTSHINQIVEDLGFYPVKINLDILKSMELYDSAILFLGLIFDIIILLFIILSILLVYSLLMISVETKTFEFGVMRMTGLSKSGLVTLIIVQSLMFVIPSIAAAFILTFPTLSVINKSLFSPEQGVNNYPLPSGYAVI